MPTTPTDTFTVNRLDPAINPEEAMESIIHVGLAPSLTLAKGTVLGKITATGKYAAYANGNSNGTETAVPLITQYALTTDANGDVTIDGEYGAKLETAPVFTQGYFLSQDLANLDAAGLTDIGGRIVTGDLTTGMIKF